MDSFYVIILGLLFILAISDLIVGVSNDAVNFLNSAVGSRIASFKWIMVVAAVGVVVGATFSTGMMEIARKGIFNPQLFFFSEVMIIFFAVMITDVVLIDAFNSLGLPTSTTVSLIFELLGAGVAIAVLKVMNDNTLEIAQFMNTGKALAIISGILLSVVVAFIGGLIIQYISRIVFSFSFKERMKVLGSLWGGLSITAITYFMVIKGLKGSSFAEFQLSSGISLSEWVDQNVSLIILGSLVAWTVLLQILIWLFKVNVSKVIVLAGTFALAMAFAGNDLVNFIGVPLAGYSAYLDFVANPGSDPDAYLMFGLAKPVETPFGFLLLAGAVMVLTLIFNKKAKKVIKTSLDLSRQDQGDERFGSSVFSKVLVRSTIRMNQRVSSFMPNRFMLFLQRQFDSSKAEDILINGEKPAFDVIRASVNLVVASILIAYGTSHKLPLSTTYVTFMVAMGSSLADNAWGRESAVYRITGVISVILGWFFTAFAAFTVAFIVAILSKIGGPIVVGLFVLAGIYGIIKSHLKGKDKEQDAEEETTLSYTENVTLKDIYEECNINSVESLHVVSDIYSNVIHALVNDNRKNLSHALGKSKEFNKRVKHAKDNIKTIVEKMNDDSLQSAQYYTLVLDYMREIGHNIMYISTPSYEHVDNNHKPVGEYQSKHLLALSDQMESFSNLVIEVIKENKYHKIDDVILMEKQIIASINEYILAQIKRLKKFKSSTKNTKLFLDLMAESKTLTLNIVNLLKSQRDLAKSSGFYKEL